MGWEKLKSVLSTLLGLRKSTIGKTLHDMSSKVRNFCYSKW